MRAKLQSNPRFIFGATVLALVLFMGLFAPQLAPYDPSLGDISQRLQGPTAAHLLGCDANGADILSIILFGARNSLYISFLAVSLTMSLGLVIGLICGYAGGWVDLVFMRLVDILLAFPGILAAMALSALLGPSQLTIVCAIAATGWTSTARLVRAQILSLKSRDYVTVAKGLGARDFYIIWRHLFPQTLSTLMVQASFSLSGVIVVEAGLSFLGLGASDGHLSWGGLLAQGAQVELSRAYHLTLVPAIGIFLLVMALNILGDALRDALDHRL